MVEKRTAVSYFAQVAIHTILILFSFSCLYPFALTFMTSITDEKEVITRGYQLIPEIFSFDAYKFVFSTPTIFDAYRVSAIITIVGTVMGVVLSALAGYVMSMEKIRYRNAIAFFFYIPMVFNAGLVPWYLVCTQVLQLKNTYWAMILPSMISPFNIFLLRNYFKTIPASLIEAAEIDGANSLYIFFKLIMPLSRAIFATIILFLGLAYWNNWGNALYLITDRKLFPLQFIIYQINQTITFIKQYGTYSTTVIPGTTATLATLFVVMWPIVVVYPFIQKYFTKGILIGAVKG